MPPRFNVLRLNRLRISNHLSVLETLRHFFEKNLSHIQSKTSCFSANTMGEWIHVGPALSLFLCSLSSLELPSGFAVFSCSPFALTPLTRHCRSQPVADKITELSLAQTFACDPGQVIGSALPSVIRTNGAIWIFILRVIISGYTRLFVFWFS